MQEFTFFSKRGSKITFPGQGFVEQGAEAEGKKYNATLGVALDDNKNYMYLKSMKIDLDPHQIVPYVSAFGKMPLRKKWLELMKIKNPSLKKASLPVVTSAIAHGLYIAAYLFMDVGEKLITFEPYWENYKSIFELGFDVNFSSIPLFDGDKLNLKGLEKTAFQKKMFFLFNFPNNPIGYTPSFEEAMQLTAIIKNFAERGSKVVVICDDAYFGYVYEKSAFQESLFTFFSELHENVLAVKLDGASKEDYGWGLRIGFITFGMKGASDETLKLLQNRAAGAIRYTISCASHISQSLLLKAFDSPTYWQEKRENFEILQKRYEKMKELSQLEKYRDYFSFLPFNSGYFSCIKLNRGIEAEKVRKLLISKYDTGVIAVDNLIRIAFSSLREDEIQTVLDNIYEACHGIFLGTKS